MISDEWKSELLSKTNIADIVGEHVTIQNKGGRLWACCPFHNEKTPSFTVNTDRQFYHCFGCGKSGNAINFVMEIEKMTFLEACQYLAERAKMPMPQEENRTNFEQHRAQREKTLAINKIAARFFYDSLLAAQGEEAREYLKKRGITDAVIKTFGMGYAPDGWDNLAGLLYKNGYTKKDIIEAGLAKAKDDRVYDMFRNRVMMPIINNFNEVIGFGGRVMDGSEPKYLNSPETPAFNKRKNLYNLNLVRKLKNLQYIVLVEGYMDAISLHMYGVQNVVATLGTALTAEQARLAKRYTKNIVVSYDGDEAGQKATLRALDILEPEGLDVRVVSIPDGMDPDDYLKKYKKDGFIKLVSAAQGALDYKINRIRGGYDLGDGSQREKFAKECAQLLKAVESPIVREKYVRLLSDETGFSENAIYEEIGVKKNIKGNDWNNNSENTRKGDQQAAKVAAGDAAGQKSEQYVLLLLLNNPACMDRMEGHITEDDFEDLVNQKIFSVINQKIKKGFIPSGAELLSELSDGVERSRVTELLSMEPEFTGNGKLMDDYLSGCMRVMQTRKLKGMQSVLLKEYTDEKNEDRKRDLLNKINRLTKEIHAKKERLD